jgi:cytochrome c551/c552
MKFIKFVLPVLVLAGGLAVCTVNSFGKAEYTKKEKKGCTFCHQSAKPKDGKDLTEAGKYYEKNKSLEGYKKK